VLDTKYDIPYTKYLTMSGHSKWSTIKRKKAVTDAKRGQSFTKVARLITVVAKRGGDPETNPSLRLAMDKAREVNMPKDVIERAISKGVGGADSNNYSEFILEGYGPNGVALLIECLSDNRNRTVAEVRSIMGRYGGSLGEAGSTSYIFQNREAPLFEIEIGQDQLPRFESLIDLLSENDDVQEVVTNLKEGLQA